MPTKIWHAVHFSAKRCSENSRARCTERARALDCSRQRICLLRHPNTSTVNSNSYVIRRHSGLTRSAMQTSDNCI